MNIRLDTWDFNIRCPCCKQSKPGTKEFFRNRNMKMSVDFITHTHKICVCNECQANIILKGEKSRGVK